MDVSVIIVSYRAPAFLEQCLYSVEKALLPVLGEVLVVDNASGNPELHQLESRFPSFRFMWLNENLGFAKANNLALKQCKGRHILFVNPDVILPENFFQLTLPAFASDPALGALGVRMLDGSGRFLPESKRGYPGAWNSFCAITGLSRLFPRSAFWSGYHAGHLPANEDHEVPVLAGACMLLSKKAADTTRGFDERFFMYAEDIDLSLRVRDAGMKVKYLAQPAIIHFKGESTDKLTLRHIRHFYGSMAGFIRIREKSPIRRWGFLLMIAAGAALAIPGMLFKKAIQAVGKIFRPSMPLWPVRIWSSAEGLQELIRLASQSPVPMRLTGHDLPLENKPLLQSGDRGALICLGDIPAGKVIAWIENQGPAHEYFFHYKGSKSLIGSHSKNSRGLSVYLG